MEEIKINTVRVDQTRHHASFTHEQIRQLIAEAVAKSAGLTLDSKNVFVERFSLSNIGCETRPVHVAVCTIVIDHTWPSGPRPSEPYPTGHSLD